MIALQQQETSDTVAVQVWIGEKPESSNERRAIIGLAQALDRLEGLYVMIANFSVGGHTIDLVVIKQDAIFVIEMKHCDGKVFGSVNGRWKVVGPTGMVKWLNQGRKNPYNQVIAYYYALRNFLHHNRLEFLSEQKASMVDFRSCKRVIAISPTLEPGSEIELDWRVTAKGLDELPSHLMSERTDEINLTPAEMEAIPRLLNCERWEELRTLLGGVMPAWDDTPDEPPPPPPPAPVATPAPAPAASSSRTTLLIMGWLTILLVVGLIFTQSREPTLPPSLTPSPIATLPPFAASPLPLDCSAVAGQTVRRQRDETFVWRTVPQGLSDDPYVAVSLERAEFCPGQIILHWSVVNRTQSIIQMSFSERNLRIRDTSGVEYPIDEAGPLRIRQDQTASARITIGRGVNPNATALTIEVLEEPFGRQVYTVQIPPP